MMTTWSERDPFWVNIQNPKVKKLRILLNIFIYLLLLHQIILLQVQVPNPLQEKIPINIDMICPYLSLM
jgi:hypothetical protein